MPAVVAGAVVIRDLREAQEVLGEEVLEDFLILKMPHLELCQLAVGVGVLVLIYLQGPMQEMVDLA